MNKKIFSKGGFTLVEIAIVLVIIGLLTGGILKGQELINNAKVRSITDRQSSLRVAWWAFIDRFGAMPGDYSQANIYIAGASNGNGYVSGRTEAAYAMQHLTSAGYLRCPQCTASGQLLGVHALPNGNNSLINIYGGVMSIFHDYQWNANRGGPDFRTVGANELLNRLTIHTGPRIPSNIMAELDRKIDDGIPNSGGVVFNVFDPTALRARPFWIIPNNALGNCIKLDEQGTVSGVLNANQTTYWRPANSDPPVFSDCGGGVFI